MLIRWWFSAPASLPTTRPWAQCARRRVLQIAAQLMGNIVRINVREGDRVSKGQLLAVIDDSQMRSSLDRATAGRDAAKQQVAAADADYSLAESTLKRYQDLFEKKSV